MKLRILKDCSVAISSRCIKEYKEGLIEEFNEYVTDLLLKNKVATKDLEKKSIQEMDNKAIQEKDIENKSFFKGGNKKKTSLKRA